MTNEKDSNEIHKLFLEFHYADNLGVIKSKLAEYVATVRTEEREAALLQATKDVCMYCDGRALGYEEAVGPNSAGNYTHEAKNKARLVTSGTNGIVLCKSSAIHARMNFEKAHSGILSRES